MPKITPSDRSKNSTIVVKTQKPKDLVRGYQWWNAANKSDLCQQLISTAAFLKEQQQFRYRQAGVFSRLYGNMPLYQMGGAQMGKMDGSARNLPIDRPTMNVVQSCVDTLVSRITQSRPRPVFLTDNGDYKQRTLAKELNNFIMGEFFQTKAYELGALALRDAAVLGTGCIKVFEGSDKRVQHERVLMTELLVDPNEALYGSPRSLYQLQLVDRAVLASSFPKYRSDIQKAEQAYPDAADSMKTVSDQVMVVEAWHLPSGPEAGDGLHSIACTSGLILEEEFEKQRFPFAFLHYSPRLLGFWGQGLAEQLMGTQIEINKLLMTISKSINIMGVPRVWLEDGSKVVKANFNNEIGMIGTFRGTPPIVWEGTSGIAGDIYAQLQRLIEYAYQQSGVSALAATSQKPAGLNSGEAIRNYDDLQSDRFAALSRRMDNFFIDQAYLDIDQAKDIAIRDGKYQTVYPNKNGAKQIDLPKADLLDDPFVIQCFDSSSLPRDPSGRMQKVAEMAQAGWIDSREARRLLDFPDLEQNDKLENAAEERILQVLDQIVEDGKLTPPDGFMDLTLAKKLALQYYNLYIPAKLEESRADLLRTFIDQVSDELNKVQAAMQPPPGAPAQGMPAVPAQPPTSQLLPQ